MLERVVNYLNRPLLLISRVLNAVGAVTMVAVMLLVVAEVCGRHFFQSPIRGTRDITILGFSIMVFVPMALCTFKEGHVSITVVTERLPKLLRAILEPIILLLTTATLGLVTWQLFVHALRLQTMGQTSKILEIPYYPFLYLATLGIFLMTLAYLVKLLVSIGKLSGRK